jgi:hypothetical protein
MKANDEVMLTTINNPFNPFTQFDNWLNFDYMNGTECCGMIARIAKCSEALSDELNDIEIEKAMDSIVDSMPGYFIKLHKSNADQTINSIQSQIAKQQTIA